MNLENKMKNAVEEAKEILQNTEDKTEAVVQAIEKIKIGRAHV